jgi:hypothetical protein
MPPINSHKDFDYETIDDHNFQLIPPYAIA